MGVLWYPGYMPASAILTTLSPFPTYLLRYVLSFGRVTVCDRQERYPTDATLVVSVPILQSRSARTVPDYLVFPAGAVNFVVLSKQMPIAKRIVHIGYPPRPSSPPPKKSL